MDNKLGNVKGTTKSGGQKHKLDKFYTCLEVANMCIAFADVNDFNVVIEPSAGSGSFSDQLKNCIALDLEPEGKGIIKRDFFEFVFERSGEHKVLVIGNPPFGQQNKLAVDFINHAAGFADRVAFILPISFKKESIHRRINSQFSLVKELELPTNSFVLNGEPYGVKCVFQVWDKMAFTRDTTVNKKNLNENNLFTFVKKADEPDFCIQRVGGNAGKASMDWQNKSEQSNYFIQLKKTINKNNITNIVDTLNNIVYPGRDHAVGPRSLSKKEVNAEINKHF